MAVGRPKRDDDEVCPVCSLPGYSYPVPSWNSANKHAPRNMYPRFIHKDRRYLIAISVNTVVNLLLTGSEYNRRTKEVTTFQYNPDESKFEDILKQWKKTEALPVIIYSFSEIPDQLKPELVKIRKSTKIRPTRNELKWIGKQKGYEYLNELSNNDLVSFGEEALKVRNKICESKFWLGYITEFSDKRGMFTVLQESREKSDAIRSNRKRIWHGPSHTK